MSVAGRIGGTSSHWWHSKIKTQQQNRML